MPYAKLNSINLYYEVHGEGKPLLFLNGIFMTTDSWIYQTRLLSKKYRVILHDCRGMGRSDKPHESYSMAQHAEDAKALLEYLNVDEATLIGTSYGGEIALAYAVRFPVENLVVIDSVSEIQKDLEIKGRRWLNAYMTRDAEKFIAEWIGDVYSDEFLEKHETALMERLVPVFKNFDYDAGMELFKCFLRLKDSPLTFDLKKISSPTLIMAGEKDFLKPERYARIIHEQIPKSEFHIIHGAGHAATIERWEEVNTLILGFLEKQDLKRRNEDGRFGR